MALPSHLPDTGTVVELFLSSTWGRADQHTSRDSNRVWGVLFCAQESPRINFRASRSSCSSRSRTLPPLVPGIALPSHLPDSRSVVELFLSSTWGRADQQTSHDSNRVWGVLFCARKSLTSTCAASTSRPRNSALPCLLMWPNRCLPPELSSRGISPDSWPVFCCWQNAWDRRSPVRTPVP